MKRGAQTLNELFSKSAVESFFRLYKNTGDVKWLEAAYEHAVIYSPEKAHFLKLELNSKKLELDLNSKINESISKKEIKSNNNLKKQTVKKKGKKKR